MKKNCFAPLCLIVLLIAAYTQAEDRIRQEIADTLLLYQRANGGWPKNFEWKDKLSDQKKQALLSQKKQTDTTIDNSATRDEIRYLAKAYASLRDERYRQAAMKGLQFLVKAQYHNGGWPQYYPIARGYSRHITFNDNAMIGVMSLFRDIVQGKPEFAFVNHGMRQQMAKANDRGIECILECQIEVNGKKTVWCAQHDEETLEPRKARSYELASLSGAESVKIVRFLMAIEDPSPKVVDAIESAVAWFDQVKIVGKKIKTIQDPSAPKGRDRVIVEDPSAPPLWARFYEIETMRPFFCSRDGIPKYKLSEISHERRNGYSWLGSYADDLLDEAYPAWQKKRTLAFPTAEGYGRFASGGRGGDVYHVTNLDDSGPGSLRTGLDSIQGPRTIVFEVSGTIELKSAIKIQTNGLTIAGQTAPGDGITIKDHKFGISKSSHIIVRYIRIRLGDKNKPRPSGPDAVSVDNCDHLIFDHVSTSWGIDGNQDTGNLKNYTFQWSILSEGLHDSLHEKGPHAMCGSFRKSEGHTTIHHSIFASSRDRHPSLSGNQNEPNWIIDFRNNIVYNWTKGGTANVGDAQINLINNIFRPGPETGTTLPIAMKAHTAYAAHGYMSGNVFDERPELTADNYAAMDMERWADNYKYLGTLEHWRVDRVFDTGFNAPITHSAEEARRQVLAHAGASLVRDAVDKRLMKDIRNRTGKLLDSQDEVGGWPELKTKPAPKDLDRDGMADAWETANNLDPTNPEDRNGDVDKDGYTNLEEYLNSLCPRPPK